MAIDAGIGLLDGMLQTLNPLQTWLPIPSIGPIFGNNTAYNIGYAGGVIAGIGLDIVMFNAMGAECATASTLTQLAKLAGKARTIGDMADATANIFAGKDVGMNVARLALNALALFSSTSCFVAGTQVIVGINPDGSYREESIETVQEGDRILTRNQYDPDAPLEIEQVTAVYQHQVNSLRIISYQDASGNVEAIQTTDDHPFYVQGLGWTGAQYLEAGNVLTTPTGGTAVVIGNASQVLDQPITVYNLQVASDHTYFVEDGQGAQTPVWVHNQCTEWHHAWPSYLGGASGQTLVKMPQRVHWAFHAALDTWKGGKYARYLGAAHFEGMSKRRIVKELTEFYQVAEGGRFRKYLDKFLRAVEESGF